MSQLKGGGGKPKTPPSPVNTPDNLRSADTVEMVLGLGMGPIKGLANGHKRFYIGDTALQRQDGGYNFSDFDLKIYPGDHDPEMIKFRLGGESSNSQVGVSLAYNVPVTRQTTHGNIDAIDIRMVVGALYKQVQEGKKPGVFDHTYRFRIRYKPVSSTSWGDWTDAGAFTTPNNPYVPEWDTSWSPDSYQDGSGNWHDPHQARVWGDSIWNNSLNWYHSGGLPPIYGNLSITGKTTSAYVKEYRIPVKRIPEPYQIEIMQLSPDSSISGDPQYINEVTWESFQTIDNTPKFYPNVALAQVVAKSTDQFSSIPSMWGEYDGLIVRLPSNYNPYNNQYTGLWDGTWKYDWTNNPVWILYEAIHNTEWGWSAYTPVNWSKYEAYDLAQICDYKLPNGKPRYTFNAYITEPMDGREFCRYIAGSFNSIITDDNNGNVRILMDKDDPAVAIVGPESIIGDFEYTYTDVNTRFNDMTVVFANPEIDYNEDRRRIHHPDQIDQFGRIPFDFVAVGCTDENEAVRKATRRMVSATTETEMVSFRTTRLASYWDNYEVILITDPIKGYGLSGRFKSFSGTDVTLRDPIYLEVGVAYALEIQGLEGIVSRNVVTPAVTGWVSTLKLASPLNGSTVGQKAQFSLKQAGAGYGLPKPYRLMRVLEVDGNPDLFEVTAIEINRLKYAAEDNAELVGEAIYSFPQKKEPARPTNVVARNMSRAAEDGTMIYTARIDFTKAADPYTTGYYLRYRLTGETEYTIIEIDGSGTTVDVPSAGLWEFQVQTRNIWSQQSPWVSTTPPTTLIDKIKAISGGRIVSAEGSVNQIKIEVEYPTDQPDLRYAVIYAHDTNTSGLATEIAKMDSTTFHHTGLSGVVTYYYWVKFEDNIGNRGPFTSSNGVEATTTLLDGADIEDGTLTSQKFEVGFDPVQSVDELPTSNLYTGRVVLLRSNNTLYEFDGTQWVAMTGNLAEAAGIEAVDALPTNLGPADQGKVVLLKLDNKIYRWTGTAWISGVEAEDIAGQIVSTQIANNAITNAKLAAGLTVPGSGPALPTLPSTSWPDGALFVLTTDGKTYTNRGGFWSASVLTNQLSGQIADAQLDGISAAKLIGEVIGSQIADAAISAIKIANGAVTTPAISAGAIVASKMFIGDTSNMVPDSVIVDPASWQFSASTATIVTASPDATSKNRFNVLPGTADVNVYSSWFPVEQGAEMFFSTIMGYGGGTIGGGSYVYLQTGQDNGLGTVSSVTNNSPSGVQTATTRAKFSGSVVVPLGHNVARLRFRRVTGGDATALFDSPIVRRMATGELIVDGAITAIKLSANSVTAGKIEAGAINATHVSAGAITASKLAIGDTSNMFPDPDYMDLELYEGYVAGLMVREGANNQVSAAKTLIAMGVSATEQSLYTPYAPIEPSKDYYYSQMLRVSNNTLTLECHVEYYFYNGTTNTYTARGSEVLIVKNTTSWERISKIITTPSNANRVRFRYVRPAGGTGGNALFGEPIIRRASSGELIVDGAITTDKLQANAVVAGKIAAGAILTSKLAVGDYSNLVNDNFSDLASWSNTTSAVAYESGNSLDVGKTTWRWVTNRTGLGAFAFVGDTSSEHFSVEVGGAYHGTATVRMTAAAVGRHELYLMCYDASNTILPAGSLLIGRVDADGTAKTVTLSGIVTVPAGSVTGRIRMRVATNGSGVYTSGAYFRDLFVRRAASGNLIVDGAITADKILANAITTAKLATNAVTSDKVAANAITAGKISVSNLAAISVNAGTITAGLLRNSAGTMQVDLNNSRIVFNNGTTMKVTGNGFGTSNQFIEWSGPSMAVNLCSEANATAYLKTNGSAYFGGNLSAGTSTTGAKTTSLALLPSVETAIFGSQGKQIRVTASFVYMSSSLVTGYNPRPSNTGGSNTGNVRVSRSIDNGATWTVIHNMSIGGTWAEVYYDNGTEPGQPNWTGEKASTATNTVTFNDPLVSTANRKYKIEVTTQAIKRYSYPNEGQSLSVLAVEE